MVQVPLGMVGRPWRNFIAAGIAAVGMLSGCSGKSAGSTNSRIDGVVTSVQTIYQKVQAAGVHCGSLTLDVSAEADHSGTCILQNGQPLVIATWDDDNEALRERSAWVVSQSPASNSSNGGFPFAQNPIICDAWWAINASGLPERGQSLLARQLGVGQVGCTALGAE